MIVPIIPEKVCTSTGEHIVIIGVSCYFYDGIMKEVVCPGCHQLVLVRVQPTYKEK
jgi:hypothetical protein